MRRLIVSSQRKPLHFYSQEPGSQYTRREISLIIFLLQTKSLRSLTAIYLTV